MVERSLSKNSIEAYARDFRKLKLFLESHFPDLQPGDIQSVHLEKFIVWINRNEMSERSQARILSGIKAFFKYLIIEDIIKEDPSELLEGPSLIKKIPEVLGIEEIKKILESVDLSHPLGHRNRAILETLYACGLRVSELISLKLSNYFPQIGYIKVIGKNNKERIVPIGESAIKYIDIYIRNMRNVMPAIQEGHQDILFLNRRGKKLTRIMIYHIVQEAAQTSEINKKLSPHMFRHSFATHLVEGGADLRAVQDMLGHESITTTEIYTHLDQKYLKDTILMYHPRSKMKP